MMSSDAYLQMERDEMMHNLNAKVTEVEGLRHSREDLSKKIKQQDEHLSQVCFSHIGVFCSLIYSCLLS